MQDIVVETSLGSVSFMSVSRYLSPFRLWYQVLSDLNVQQHNFCMLCISGHVHSANAAILLTKEKAESQWLGPTLIWTRYRDRESRVLLPAV